jgi:hypothetical protein
MDADGTTPHRRAWQTSDVTLPVPPPGPCRQLVQVVWELTFTGLRWPTFAELDRRLDQAYDVQAFDVLRDMPPGLLWGIGADSPPTDDQTIGLTVAGIAACPNSDEILTAFIDFVRMAASTERDWRPLPDQASALPRLTDAEFTAQARTLPAAGRDALLLLLFRVLQIERDGWGRPMIDPQSGNWAVSLTREIRPFRGVADLDDYWSRRHKPWKAPAPAPRPLAPTSEAAWNRAKLLTAEPGLLAEVLLERIYDEAQPHCQPGISDSLFDPIFCPRIERVDDQAVTQAALVILQSQGYVELLAPASGDPWNAGSSRVMITKAGAARVVHTRSVMTNGMRRSQAARNALLAWLYEQRTDPRGSVIVDNVLRSPHGAFNGQFFGIDDVDDAASYLREKGLIAGSGADQRRGPVLARITAEGMDCIERGGNVADYIRQPDKPGVTYSFRGPVSGSNFAVGDHSTQYAAATGLDVNGLRDVMAAVAGQLSSLQLEPLEERALAAAAGEVTTEIAGQAPDKSRISAALKKTLPLLAKAGNQALAAAFRIAIDAERAKLGLPPAD